MALSVYTPTGIVHETSVDFTNRVLAEPVHLVQYDESLPVVAVTCLDAGQYMTLTASDTVSIRMDKGDGTFIYNPALGMSADGHIVYIQITLQMTVNYGRFEPVLELLRGNGYGCSSPIPLFIDVNPVPNSAIESADEFNTIAQMYGTVVGFSDALDYLNTPAAQNDVANAEENANAAIASASAAATSESNAADSEASAARSAAAAQAVVDSSTITFAEASTRENIESGETASTLFGKIKKWFTDLAAFMTSTTSSLNTLHAKTNNYFGMRYVDIPGSQLSNGKDLSSYIEPTDGFKFLCWFPCVVTSGFVSNVPAYIANPAYPAGGFYCNNISTASNAVYRCMYIQIKNNTQ